MERSSKNDRAPSSPGSGIEVSEDPTKHDTKIQVKLQDPIKAGLAECFESRNPIPPNQKGNVACNQAPSEMLQHMILLRHSRNLESKHVPI